MTPMQFCFHVRFNECSLSGHELWVVTERMRSQIQAADLSLLLQQVWAVPQM